MPERTEGGRAASHDPGPVHVVDDEVDVRASLALLLQSHGYAVRTHASAEAALAALQGDAPAACVVADMRMPGMDGLALQRVLAARRALPVLIVTAHADVPLAVRAMREGAADFIEKPYDAERLLAAVAEAIEEGRRRQALGERRAAAAARLGVLSAREREVFDLLVRGHANRQVADLLGISIRTAEVHRARLMEKLACFDLPAMVRLALDAEEPVGPAARG